MAYQRDCCAHGARLTFRHPTDNPLPPAATRELPLPSRSAKMASVKTIDQMTQEEKLQTMESLWDSLWPTQKTVPSPEWHGSILQERAEHLASGRATFTDWDAAKKRLSGQS